MVLTGIEADGWAQAPGADVFVVDLGERHDRRLRRSSRSMRAGGELGGTRTLAGFYSHVDVDVRERALAAGFDLVVPRSRINREGATS